ncbi:MAG: hypothetical protein JW941_00390 [Candidatus Coatesbacteria bacterium]|nr:hypothetical protein [Candidatus Coatesbacteria bacterium]
MSSRRAFAAAISLLLLAGPALAGWDNAHSRCIFPFWFSGGDWYTCLVFVNGSDETSDTIYIRFFSPQGALLSDPEQDGYSIRQQEQLLFSTIPSVPTWIPTAPGMGYAVFRVQRGGYIFPCCMVYSQATTTNLVVPAYWVDEGF